MPIANGNHNFWLVTQEVIDLKLPNYQYAIVRQAKITDYLLSLSHSSGRSKAKFFRSYGFTGERWPELAQAFKTLVANYEVTKVELTKFGTRYVVEGLLNTQIHGIL